MQLLADGGALADAGLVVDILIAVGTIGAALVALRLGVQAQRATGAQECAARMKLNRQVLCLYVRDNAGQRPGIQVVNASPEPVTHLLVQVTALAPSDEMEGNVWWEWDNKALNGYPTMSYLLSGAVRELSGAFRPRLDPDADPVSRRGSGAVDVDGVSVSLTWQDAYGDVWQKRARNDEAFPTDLAKPGRDLRDLVPKYMWPDYWQARDEVRFPLPARVRLSRRIRLVGAKLRRLLS